MPQANPMRRINRPELAVSHPQYRLQSQLGSAPGRQTWLAQDLSSTPPEPVILKLLAFSDEMGWQSLTLFEREAQVLQTLQHPRLPRYRASFSLDSAHLPTANASPLSPLPPASPRPTSPSPIQWFGLAQDYIPGQSLKTLLQQGHRFKPDQICTIATQVLDILAYLHSRTPQVLHRDIKPSNLILGEDQQIYLIDLGAAQTQTRDLEESLGDRSFTIVGTYGYTPLEQFGGRPIPASDLYALGATLIHLLTGIPPADLPQQNLQLQFADRTPHPLNPALIHWLQTLTHPDPHQRYPNATSARQALHHPIPPSPHSPIPRPSGSNLHIQHSPQRLLIELPGNDLGIVLSGLAIVFFGAGLLLNPWLMALALGLGPWGLWLAAPHFIRLEREFSDLHLILFKTLFGQILRRTHENRVHIQHLFHTLRSAEQRLALHQSNRTLVIQTARREYALGTTLSREESAWLMQEIQAWLERSPNPVEPIQKRGTLAEG